MREPVNVHSYRAKRTTYATTIPIGNDRFWTGLRFLWTIYDDGILIDRDTEQYDYSDFDRALRAQAKKTPREMPLISGLEDHLREIAADTLSPDALQSEIGRWYRLLQKCGTDEALAIDREVELTGHWSHGSAVLDRWIQPVRDRLTRDSEQLSEYIAKIDADGEHLVASLDRFQRRRTGQPDRKLL